MRLFISLTAFMIFYSQLAIASELMDKATALCNQGQYKECLRLFQIEAKRNRNPDAMSSIGTMYITGAAGEQNWEKSYEWMKKSAALGGHAGMYGLANCYYLGWQHIRDLAHLSYEERINKAVTYLKKALEDDRLWTAKVMMGNFYRVGIGVEQNYHKAEELYNEALAQAPEYYANKGILKKLRDACAYYGKLREEHRNSPTFLGVSLVGALKGEVFEKMAKHNIKRKKSSFLSGKGCEMYDTSKLIPGSIDAELCFYKSSHFLKRDDMQELVSVEIALDYGDEVASSQNIYDYLLRRYGKPREGDGTYGVPTIWLVDGVKIELYEDLSRKVMNPIAKKDAVARSLKYTVIEVLNKKMNTEKIEREKALIEKSKKIKGFL